MVYNASRPPPPPPFEQIGSRFNNGFPAGTNIGRTVQRQRYSIGITINNGGKNALSIMLSGISASVAVWVV